MISFIQYITLIIIIYLLKFEVKPVNMAGLPSNWPSFHLEKSPVPCCIPYYLLHIYSSPTKKRKPYHFYVHLYVICTTLHRSLHLPKMWMKNEKEISTTKSEYKCTPAKIKRSNNINTNSLPSVSDDLLFFNYRNSSIHNLIIQTFEVDSFNKIFKRELDTFSDNNVHISLCHQHYCKRIKKRQSISEYMHCMLQNYFKWQTGFYCRYTI